MNTKQHFIINQRPENYDQPSTVFFCLWQKGKDFIVLHVRDKELINITTTDCPDILFGAPQRIVTFEELLNEFNNTVGAGSHFLIT